VRGLREVYDEQSQLLRKYQDEWQTLVSKDLAALNEQAKTLDAPAVIVPRTKKD
jgi:hypothetical protein